MPHDQNESGSTLRPARFFVLRGDMVVGIVGLIVFLAGSGVSTYYLVQIADRLAGAPRILVLVSTVLLWCGAIGLPLYMMRRSRREGTIVIDPDKGEIRIGQAYEIPFSQVRQVEVVEHEYTYRAINSQHDTVTSDMTGWAIDLGAGRRLLGENGLSEKRVIEVADALRERVQAYRARTQEGIEPLPEPDEPFLERLAGSLKQEGEVFAPDWLDPDGPMADMIRAWDYEPTEATMGPDGTFAQALRKAGYEFGELG